MQKYFFNLNIYKQVLLKNKITIKQNIYSSTLKVIINFIYLNYYFNLNIFNTKIYKNIYFNSYNFITYSIF